MAFITTENMIISTDGIQWVEFNTSGTGAQSNPFKYRIDIYYFNNKEITLRFDQDEKAEARNIFNKISKILSEKA